MLGRGKTFVKRRGAGEGQEMEPMREHLDKPRGQAWEDSVAVQGLVELNARGSD